MGKLLAEMLKFTFIDLDKEVARQSGGDFQTIYAKYGGQYLRRKELKVLAHLPPQCSVIATGSDTPARILNLFFLLRSGYVLWLDSPLHIIMARMRMKCISSKSAHWQGLPHGTVPDEDCVRSRMRFMQSFYRFADVRIDGTPSPQEVASDIYATLCGAG